MRFLREMIAGRHRAAEGMGQPCLTQEDMEADLRSRDAEIIANLSELRSELRSAAADETGSATDELDEFDDDFDDIDDIDDWDDEPDASADARAPDDGAEADETDDPAEAVTDFADVAAEIKIMRNNGRVQHDQGPVALETAPVAPDPAPRIDDNVENARDEEALMEPTEEAAKETEAVASVVENASPALQDDPAPAEPVEQVTEAAPPTERPAARRIWDVEGANPAHGAQAAASAAAPSPVETPSAEAQPRRVVAAVPPAPTAEAPTSPLRAGRVKTRLLGFEHGKGLGNDPFEIGGRSKTVQEARFPVGWIVVVRGPGRGASFTLFNGVAQIGRGEDQAIQLDFGDNSISRSNHAAVAFDEEQGAFFLGHGGKANLVRLNDTPVLSTERLENGDLIRIGETTLRFVALCGSEFSWTDERDDGVDSAAIA